MARMQIRRRQSEAGAQSLEWLGLGSFVVAALYAATQYAQSHLGSDLGSFLVNHLKTALGN